MKTILFFDRSNLTNLYILLTKELQEKANIIHVAFSSYEAKKLEEAGITDYYNYQKHFSELVDKLVPSKEIVSEIDSFIITQSKGQFSLNSSIQNDRGYSVLNYQESLLLACCHYTLWKQIFNKYHVDYLYHEVTSQFMVHIAGLLCKNQGGHFLYPTQLIGDKPGYYFLNLDGENMQCDEINKKFEYYKNNPGEIDIKRCEDFVERFRNEYKVAFGDIVKAKTDKFSLCLSSLRFNLSHLIRRNQYDRLKNNIDFWLQKNNISSTKLHNLHQYKKLGIKFNKPVEGEPYFYYSIHLEPEAVVLYQGGGLYVNQVKLIENIAASLPAGYYLYVKDHPHEFAYRNAEDYYRLMKVPNIRLIDQRIPGKALIKNAVGVFSIVGTAGLEGLLFGKQVYMFGNNYYTVYPKANYIENIRDLRSMIYNNMNESYEDDVQFYAYVYAYLKSLHKGFVTYFGNDRVKKSGIDEIENSKIVAESILNMLQ